MLFGFFSLIFSKPLSHSCIFLLFMQERRHLSLPYRLGLIMQAGWNSCSLRLHARAFSLDIIVLLNANRISSYSCTMWERGSALSSSMFALIGPFRIRICYCKFLVLAVNKHCYIETSVFELLLRILQGRVAPAVKSRLYENTEVRYNNPTLRAQLFLVSFSRETLQNVGKWQVTVSLTDINSDVYVLWMLG